MGKFWKRARQDSLLIPGPPPVIVLRLMDGLAGRPGIGSSGTQPPAAASASSGNYLAGTSFEVTQSGFWLAAYWWYCCATGQQTTPVDLALWQLTSGSTGLFVTGSHVTSGTLIAGTFNQVILPSPVPLSIDVPYIAQVGYVDTTGFPLSQNQFAGTDPYAGGIVNGALTAPPAGSPNILAFPQGSFSSANGADPTAGLANSAFNDSNFWVDLQVTNQAPGGATYRLFPSNPLPLSLVQDTANNFTLGVEISLSRAATLKNIWFYSPATLTQLPTRCALWSVAGQSIVAGTDNAAPAWSGVAGSGWVSVSYASPVVPAGKYKITVFNGAVTPAIWNSSTSNYWSTGPGAGGLSTGPLAAPNNANADPPGQSSYHQGTSFTYPDTNAGPFNYWVDAEFG